MVKINLHDVDLSGTNLGRADLSQSILQDSTLAGAWLEHADLSDVTFLRANLSHARLDKASDGSPSRHLPRFSEHCANALGLLSIWLT